ncbi:MAG: ATP-binding protein [Geobacteraceae bacterium]|nr:ATP-binding protein [Geobacteraceae bacterium]NTW81521.1 ATP-binding protein [Geobacteraceae bacterium]
MTTSYERPFVAQLEKRFSGDNPLIQVLVGPRQVGKTTGVRQLLARYPGNSHYANADDLLITDRTWLIEQWQKALLLGDGTLLIIDEVQKISNWSETIKSLWDSNPRKLRVIVLGSSSLQIQTGLTESLAGRFELTKIYHWTYTELKHAFGYNLERFLLFGGYPGSVSYEDDYDRWYSYLKDSIIESVIGKDILLNRTVGNPALFRQAFEILCRYPAQEISYTKLLGQLQDKGNTDLIKYYIELYAGAFLIHPLEKYSAKGWLTRSSSPKILISCPALYTMTEGPRVLEDLDKRGRVFELAVGSEMMQLSGELFYWREKNAEVDFIHRYQGRLYAIEVKSGRRKSAKGLESFIKQFPDAIPIIITPDNFPLFSEDPRKFLAVL